MKVSPHRLLVAGAVALLLLGGLLLARLAPWWQAGATPVEFVLHAPADAELRLHFAEGEPPVRLVPVGEVINDWSWYWGAELPPRPRYELALEVIGAAPTWTFARMEVLTLSPRRARLSEVRSIDRGEWSLDGLRLLKEDVDRVTLDGTGGGKLRFTSPIDRRPEGYFSTLFLPLVNLLLLGLLAAGLWGSGWRFPERLGPYSPRWGRWEGLGGVLVFFIAAGVHWQLVTDSIPEYWPADSTSYVEKGLSLAYDGDYDTGGHEYELNRTPGYPLLLAAAFRLIGPSFNAVVQLQTGVLLVSFLALFWVLRRMLRPGALLVAMPLVLWSPALVWTSRQIATEPLFVSCWALGTAFFIRGWDRPPTARRTWPWLGFTLTVVAAMLVRANGILLLALPGCALVGTVVRGYFARRGFWRIELPSWRRWALLCVPFLAVVLAAVGWSVRNELSRGYASPNDLAPIVAANAPFNAGMLDLRALDGANYGEVIRARRNAGYFFHGWSLRHLYFLQITDEWQVLDDSTLDQLDAALRGFVAANNALIPWEARLVAWWRVLDWGLWLPERGPFTQDALQEDYRVKPAYLTEASRETVQKRLRYLSRDRGAAGQYPHLALEEGGASRLREAFNALVPVYPWIYRGLTLAGIGALVFAAWRGGPRRFLAVCLLVPFFLNLLLNIGFLYVIARYVQVLDGFLLLSLLAVLYPAKAEKLAA